MPQETDVFFFKENQVPMWEESPEGGIWITKLKKHSDNVNLMWEQLLLALAGELFGSESSVTGVSLLTRGLKGEQMIQVWLKDASDEKIKSHVSNRMRHFMQLDPNSTTMYFKGHKDSIKDNSTMKNALGYKFEKKKPYFNASKRTTQKPFRKDSDFNNF